MFERVVKQLMPTFDPTRRHFIFETLSIQYQLLPSRCTQIQTRVKKTSYSSSVPSAICIACMRHVWYVKDVMMHAAACVLFLCCGRDDFMCMSPFCDWRLVK